MTTEKIAPGAVVTADLADGAVTAAKMAGGQTGDAPVYGCRAWVNFDSTKNSSGTSVTDNTNRFIRAGGNINYVLRTAAGIYTVVFNTPIEDGSYALFGSANWGGTFIEVGPGISSTMTSLSCQVRCGYDSGSVSGTITGYDPEVVTVSFIR